MTFAEFKNEVIRAAESRGLTDYELYYASSESTSVSIFKSEIREFQSANEGGVCFRCIVNGRMGYASTEALDAENAAAIVLRAESNAASLESEEQEFLCPGGLTYRETEKKEYPLPDTEELIRLSFAGQRALYDADPSVIDGTATEAGISVDRIAIVNSKGLDLSEENKSGLIFLQALVSDGTEMSDSYEIGKGDLSKLDFAALSKKAAEDAKARLHAEPAPTGSYPVVFAPKAMASMLAVFSQAFSAENVRRGLSPLGGKEGTMIASGIVTILDDPFYPDSLMPRSFDAEGTPTRTKEVIKDGRLMTLLYDLKNAAAEGKESTGNAMKASYNANISIRPFTMVIKGGDLTEEELLKKAGNGVYIDSLGGLHAGANVISGDFSLQSAGFMIEDGVKTKAVKSFTVAGNFYELLKSVEAISDTPEIPGMGGVTAFASPAVLVKGLSIAGK